MLPISELECRFLHNHCSDHGSDYEGLLGSMPATQQYKLNGRFLHNRFTNFDSICGELLGLTSAIQLYGVRLCCIETQEIAVFCGEDLYSSSHGYLLLDGRLLHNRRTNFDSVCVGLLGSTPASQRYKVHLCRINTQEFAVFCGGCIRYPASDTLLDGRLLRDGLTDSDTLCGRLLAMTQASYSYKKPLPRPSLIRLQC